MHALFHFCKLGVKQQYVLHQHHSWTYKDIRDLHQPAVTEDALFTEAVELRAGVEFAGPGAGLTGLDAVAFFGTRTNIVPLARRKAKRLGYLFTPTAGPEPERPPACGYASTAKAKAARARITCKTENKIIQ